MDVDSTKMNEPKICIEPDQLDAHADLGTVLAAWNEATERLQRTHEALRSEVCRLTDELEIKNRELARKNRLADLGQIATHVAHEVRNNLVPVTLYLSLLRRRLHNDNGSLDVLTKVEAGFTALDATVNDLLHFAVDREPSKQSLNVRQLIEEVLSQLAPQLSAQRIESSIEVPFDHTIWADREMLRRAIFNLALNAIDVMPDGGQLCFDAHQADNHYELEIADSGPGLTDDALQRAFEPFFTTKNTGTGLGLAIVYRIAEAHGGTIRAQNCADRGAAFTIRIPRRQRMEAAA